MHQDRRGYWYRSKRIGGRVVREYVGRGAISGLEAQRDACNREKAIAAREEADQRRCELDALDDKVKTACEAAAAVMDATLEAAGYHRHARGQWRKRRKRRKQREENNGMAKPKLDTQTLAKAKPAAKAQLAKAQDDGMRDLIARARRDAAAL